MYFTIFLDLLGKLYVRTCKVFVKIVDFVFLYSSERVVNVAYPKRYSSSISS